MKNKPVFIQATVLFDSDPMPSRPIQASISADSLEARFNYGNDQILMKQSDLEAVIAVLSKIKDQFSRLERH